MKQFTNILDFYSCWYLRIMYSGLEGLKVIHMLLICKNEKDPQRHFFIM